MMFTTASNEKAVVAERIGEELSEIGPGERALRLFDAGMGDARVLAQLMRRLHRIPHIPWLPQVRPFDVDALKTPTIAPVDIPA